MALTKVESSLPEVLERLVQKTIGCCLAVHRELGPGLNEAVYARACQLELSHAGLQCEREKAVAVRYRGTLLCHQRIDVLVERQLILEIKSVERIIPVHVAQTVSYLRITGARVGLLVNFNVSLLKDGIRRVIL